MVYFFVASVFYYVSKLLSIVCSSLLPYIYYSVVSLFYRHRYLTTVAIVFFQLPFSDRHGRRYLTPVAKIG